MLFLLSACGDPGREAQQAAENRAPSISGVPPTDVLDGEQYEFVPTASDPDGDILTFNIGARPGWATFEEGTGRLSGTPGPSDVGEYADIVIGVSDGRLSRSLPAFSITVNAQAGNTPPTIAGTPPSAVEAGTLYDFTPTASDSDGDMLTFSVSNRPPWAEFDPATGRLSGTPETSDAGSYPDIVIGVSDGSGSDSLPPFSITVSVASANNAPVISGAPPPSIVAGNPYSFTPAASDADGDPLTFGIAGQPSWAAFDRDTGALTGIPDTLDVATYSGIVISVSDGQATSSLPPFSITVTAAVGGTATLSWSAPTENADGSQIDDLAGFVVYWGTAPDTYDQFVKIDDPAATGYVITGLAAGTYYVSVAAFDAAGNEGAYSAEMSATIP